MDHNCERHPFEVADGVCRSCRGSFCPDCLLYPFGPDNEPYCKPCAISAGGIRSTARNPRRMVVDAGRSKPGVLRRLRRKGGEEEEEVELTPEEVVELEATEARRMLDAQRLPSEPEEEPEPEPVPTPNIAPPGRFHDEQETARREVPDEIAGGLDLGSAGRSSRFKRRDTKRTRSEDDAPASDPPEPADVEPRPEAPDQPEIDRPVPAPAPEPTPEPAAASIPAAEAQTADGNPLFAKAPDDASALDDDVAEGAENGAAETSAAPEPEPVGAATSLAGYQLDDTRELLRRIASLRGD